MQEQTDEFIQTFTGKNVNPLSLKPDDIDIKDIAHSLSLTNRFTGHTELPYSVAQHSCLVHDILRDESIGSVRCGEEILLWGLLHDAAEAYFADISRPVKNMLKRLFGDAFKKVEAGIMAAVCSKFGMATEEPKPVKWADDTALANEAFSFFGNTENYKNWHHRFENGYMRIGRKISATPFYMAERGFLSRFYDLVPTSSQGKIQK